MTRTTTTSRPRDAATANPAAPNATADPAAAHAATDPTTPTVISPTRALGIAGWSRLDPLVIAALALESPVLLVGEHGTAKTLLAELVAGALGAEFRHYNASLLNYDDLVGIPIPDESGGLRFVGTEGAVWGASFVFFDEINRCRPDLQNKMFPLVHERRIGGVALTDLVHRWAAMNPPSAEDDTTGYVGTEPLDTALADRFWFVVRTPGWRDLDRAERTELVEGAVGAPEGADLEGLAERTLALLPVVEAELGGRATRFVLALVDVLAQGGVDVSPRRARMLRRALVATVAAGRALGREEPVRDTFELVVRNGLPHWAAPEPPSAAQVVAAIVQADELACDDDGLRARLLEEADPVRRVRRALELDVDDELVAATVTTALTTRPTEGERVALAAVLHFGLAEERLTPAAWSAIDQGARRVVDPGTHRDEIAPGRALDHWRRAVAWLESADGATDLQHAIVNGLGPELLADVDVEVLMTDVQDWLELFDLHARFRSSDEF